MDVDDDVEQKIEKFYALIRSMREARDRLMNGSDDQAILYGDQTLQMKQRKKLMTMMSSTSTDHKPQEQKTSQPLKNGSAAWKPSFEREDFINTNNSSSNSGVHHDLGAFKVPNSLTYFGTSSPSSSKITSAVATPDQNQVQTISSKEPLDLSLSL